MRRADSQGCCAGHSSAQHTETRHGAWHHTHASRAVGAATCSRPSPRTTGPRKSTPRSSAAQPSAPQPWCRHLYCRLVDMEGRALQQMQLVCRSMHTCLLARGVICVSGCMTKFSAHPHGARSRRSGETASRAALHPAAAPLPGRPRLLPARPTHCRHAGTHASVEAESSCRLPAAGNQKAAPQRRLASVGATKALRKGYRNRRRQTSVRSCRIQDAR